MLDLLYSATIVWEERLPNGGLSMSVFRGSKHPYLKQLRGLNIRLRKAGYDRLSILSRLLGRTISSTYDLTVGEMWALSTLMEYGKLNLEEACNDV